MTGAGVKERLVAFSYAGGWALVRALPEPVVTGAFTLGADLAWRRRGFSEK